MNQAHRKVYGDFFQQLELRLRKELTNLEYTELSVTNHFALHSQYKLTVEARLSKAGLKVTVVCDPLFPTQPPKVFCQGSYKGEYIDPITQEIDFKSFYPWTKTSSVARLLAELDDFYDRRPALPNKQNEEIVQEIEQARITIIGNMQAIDRAQLNQLYDPHEEHLLNDFEFKKDMVRRSVEVDLAKRAVKAIVDKVTDKTGGLTRRAAGKSRYDALDQRGRELAAR